MSFIVVPYETRVLGPEKFGLIGLAAAIMTYAQLAIDFGFLLSATQEVSANRDDRRKVSSIFTCVTVNKLLISVVTFFVVMLICGNVELWKEHIQFFGLFFISTMLQSLLPDYLYRGIEKMGAITIRTVLIKLFFTVMVFVLIKGPEDYLFIPILQIIGNGIALLFVYLHLFFKEKIFFVRFCVKDLLNRFKASAVFFLSRIATTVYTVANTIILDLFYEGKMTAYYTSANRLISTAKGGLSPISDSLYPYMVRNRDFKMVKKVLLIIEPIVILGCAVLFIWAKPFCIWFFGAEYEASAPILRVLLPIVVITLPNYIMGFPVLGAMGLNKQANYSVVFGSVVHIINLLVLYFSDNLSVISLGIATAITDAVILAYRCFIVYKNRHLLASCDDEV